MAIITTDIDVVVFPNWLFGRVQRYTRRQTLLDLTRDVDNDRIVGFNFLVDPDYEELRNTEFKNAGSTQTLTNWVSSKKFKYDEDDLEIS